MQWEMLNSSWKGCAKLVEFIYQVNGNCGHIMHQTLGRNNSFSVFRHKCTLGFGSLNSRLRQCEIQV